jgi:peptidoglycan hydrolase CwlO-like protein
MRRVIRSVGIPWALILGLVLLGCGQELKKESEQLKAQVASLQKENTDLQAEVMTLKGDNEALRKQLDEMKTQVERLKSTKPTRRR